MADSMRGKGEGSVYKDSSGLWAAAIELAPRDGKRRRKVIRSKDKRTVVSKLTALRRELVERGDIHTDNVTVSQWFTYWLDQVCQQRPKTLANYRSLVKNHVIPTIGTVRMDKLSAAHIRRVTDAITSKGKSPATAHTVHAIMSSALADAEREGRIGRNPAKLTRPPKKAPPKLEVLTTDEARAVLQQFNNSPSQYLWATFILTGARRGEILGLEWDRVTDMLDLSWQLQRYTLGQFNPPADYEYRQLTDTLYLTRPKSAAGWRIVPLVDPLAGVLRLWRAQSDANPHGLVFPNKDGRPLDPGAATKEWPTVLRNAGIDKHVRLHDLRHTAVDLMYDAGVDEDIIQAIVGHSTRAMTRAYRSRTSPQRMIDGMTKVSHLLGLAE